jgi:hypothetical protein
MTNSRRLIARQLSRYPSLLESRRAHSQMVKRHQGEASYASSWLYTLRVCRNEVGLPGYAARVGESHIGIGLHHGTVSLLLLAFIDEADAADACVELYEYLSIDLPDTPILVKRLPPQVADRLLVKDRFVEARPTLSPSILEDDSFPEVDVDLHQLDKARHLARKARQFANRNVPLSVRRGPLGAFEARSALKAICGSDHDKFCSYRSMVDEAIRPFGGGTYSTWLFENSDAALRYRGLYIVDALGDKLAGLYCAISSRDAGGLTEWMDMTVLSEMASRGFERVLLGGSESLGVYRYTQKLLPVPTALPEVTLVRQDIADRYRQSQ